MTQYECVTIPGIQAHDRRVWVLSQIEISSPSQLFLNDKSLLQQFEASSQELVLHLQEVSFALVGLERFVDNAECRHVVLDILPASVAVTNDAGQQPVVMTTMPHIQLSAYNNYCNYYYNYNNNNNYYNYY